jgi:cellulose synthase operon protein C
MAGMAVGLRGWARGLGAAGWGGGVGAGLPPARGAEAGDAAATKKLVAANGLFQRQLYKLAAEQYAAFLKDHPQHPEALGARYALGVCQYRMGEHEQAIAGLEAVLKEPAFTQDAEAMLVLAHAQLALGRHEKALASLDRLLDEHPDSPHAETARLNKAQVLYLANRPADAATALDTFLKEHPKSERRPEAMYFLALAQRSSDQAEAALRTLEALTREHPSSPQYWDAVLLFGQTLEATRRVDLAVKQYEKLAGEGPMERRAEGWFSIGLLEYRRQGYDASAKALSKLLVDHPQSPYAAPARLQLGLTYVADRKFGEARQVLGEVAKTDPARAATATYWLSQCDLAEKKYPDALAKLDQLIAMRPENVEQVTMDRAQVLLALEKHAEAAEAFATFIRTYPQSPMLGEAGYRRAFALHKAGKFEQSLTALAEAKLPAEHPLAGAAEELAAEDLFLLKRYPEAQKAFAALKAKSQGEQKLRHLAREGQAAYFGKDYAKAVELLSALADEPGVAADPELSKTLLVLGDALLQTGRAKEAAALLERYNAGGKVDPESQYKLGLAQIQSGKQPEAMKTLEKVANASGDSPWVARALFEVGQLKHRQKDSKGARETLEKVLATKSPPADAAGPAIYLLGWLDFEAKKYAEAATRFEMVIAKYGDQPVAGDARFYRAVSLKEAGQDGKAIEAFQQYLSQHGDAPNATKARLLMAASLVKLDKHAEAIEILAKLAADEKAVTDEVLYNLGWSLAATNKPAEAEKAYRRLIEQFPQSKLDAAARVELAETLLKQDRAKEAAPLLEKVVANGSADAKTISVAVYRLGIVYEKLGEAGKASSAFEKYLESEEKGELKAWAHYQAGVNFVRQNKLEEALKHFQSALSSDPPAELAVTATLKLGETQAQAGDFEASERTYRAFLDKNGTDKLAYQAMFGVGWALENRKDYDGARQWYEKVIAATNAPTAARAQFQIGETYFAQQRHDEAVKALLAVADVYAYPEWAARATFEAGRVFEQMKQPEQARRHYEMVLQKYKDSPEAALADRRLKQMK